MKMKLSFCFIKTKAYQEMDNYYIVHQTSIHLTELWYFYVKFFTYFRIVFVFKAIYYESRKNAKVIHDNRMKYQNKDLRKQYQTLLPFHGYVELTFDLPFEWDLIIDFEPGMLLWTRLKRYFETLAMLN